MTAKVEKVMFGEKRIIKVELRNSLQMIIGNLSIENPDNTNGNTSLYYNVLRGGSRTAATSKMEHFVIIVNGWKPLTIITKSSILDVAAALDPPLVLMTMLFTIIMTIIIMMITIKAPTPLIVIQNDIFKNTKIFSTKTYHKVEAVFK